MKTYIIQYRVGGNMVNFQDNYGCAIEFITLDAARKVLSVLMLHCKYPAFSSDYLIKDSTGKEIE